MTMVAPPSMTTAETVRLRVVFEDPHMLSKSKKKEGLNRSWLLLKPYQHSTISHFSSHLQSTFRLHRTCPNGIILFMDGFVLPPFESTCILKDKDIVCVKRKGSISTDDEPAMLPYAPDGGSIKLPELLAIEGCQVEAGECKTMLLEDGNDKLEEDAVYVESNAISKKRKASKKHCKTMLQEDDNDQLDENAVYVEPNSKKRKSSKKLKSPSKKKIKLSSTEKLAVIPEVHEEENRSFQGCIHHQSLVKKDNDKSSKLSTQPKKSSNPDHKQSNNFNGSKGDETRFLQPQDDGETGTKKMPSRSARRKKAKRRWLRELKLKNENEKLHPSPVLEKDGQKLPIKDNSCVVSDVHQQSDEESESEDDIVPVEIRPGHIRFEPLRKDQAVPQNQFPVETFQWNGITSKKKGQKWGKERMSSRKQDDYEHSSQEWPDVHNAEKETFQWNGITSKKKGQEWGKERMSSRKQDDYEHSSQERPVVHNAEKQHTLNHVDFDKLTPYTNSPKEGDVIAYRLIELSESWTPELSSSRVGKILQYDAKSNRIQLEPVLEYPFDFKKKLDEEDDSSLQSDPSPYGEDGSLEIDYTSLADVRMVKHGNSDSATVIASSDAWVNPAKATNGNIDEKLAGDQTTVRNSKPEREGHIPAEDNGEVNVWDEINEALTAKKAKLSQEDGWNKENSGAWSRRALRCSALGPTMAFLRSQNGL